MQNRGLEKRIILKLGKTYFRNTRMSHFKFIVYFLCLCSCKQKKQPLAKPLDVTELPSGKVIYVFDGDTFELLDSANNKIRVRIYGIDAPEREMPYHQASKKYLGRLCFGKMVHIKTIATDKFRRKIAFTYLPDGTNIGNEMIKAGFAWHFERFTKDSLLTNLETSARKNKFGLWQDSAPTPPWEKRKEDRDSIEAINPIKR